jgi:hypothetical protein
MRPNVTIAAQCKKRTKRESGSQDKNEKPESYKIGCPATKSRRLKKKSTVRRKNRRSRARKIWHGFWLLGNAGTCLENAYVFGGKQKKSRR